MGETARAIHTGYAPGFVRDRLLVNCLRRTLADALAAPGTEIGNPGVIIVGAERQIFDVGEDRCQSHARAVFGGDD